MKKTVSVFLVLAILACMFNGFVINTAAQGYDWIPASTIDHSSYAYTLAVLPDIQNLTQYYPAALTTTINYITSNALTQRIKFVMGMGDITNQNTTEQWNTAKSAIETMNGVVPYSVIPGNHDYDRTINTRALSGFDAAFPISEYQSKDFFGGSYSSSSISNAYYKITANDIKYLIMSLEFAPRNEVLTWAGDIIAANPDYNVIITTHSYMSSSGSYVTASSYLSSSSYNFATTGGNFNDGAGIWDKLASKYSNIQMILCGHVPTPELIVRRDRGINNNSVYQILADTQGLDLDFEGLGMIMFLRFSDGGTKVDVQYYSVVKNMYLKKSNTFSFDMHPDFNSPIVFTEIHPDAPGTDIAEYFEIMNISDYPVDLYDYQMMYSGGSGRGPKKINLVNYFADRPDEVILEPGELAVVWSLSTTAYTNGYATITDGVPVYDLDLFRGLMASLYGSAFNPDARVIIMDRTNKKLPLLGDTTTAGLSNSGNFNFYLTLRGETNGFGALCVINVISVAEGMSSHYGMPLAGSVDQFPVEQLASPSPGMLSSCQSEIAAAALPAPYSLVITEVYRDTPGPDLTEGFEVMNISDSPIDLYDYKIWRYHDPSNIWSNVTSATAATAVSDNLYGAALSDTSGKYILMPGEVAFFWTVSYDMYDNGYAVNDLLGNPIYYPWMFRDAVLTDQRVPFDPNCKIIPFDNTLGGGYFNMPNSCSFRLYISDRNGNIDSAVAVADVVSTTSTQGTSLSYGPSAHSSQVLTTLDRLAFPSLSYLTDEQKRLWQVSDDPSEYGLVITELCRNQDGLDVTEGFEIMNLSDQSIDLYNYKAWRYHSPDNDWNAIESAAALTAVPANLKSQTLSDTPGQYVLAPGEIAFCWTIFPDTYDSGYASTDALGNPVYNYTLFRQTVEQQQGVSLPKNFKIIPLDYTLSSSSRFNLTNFYRFRLYLTARNDTIDNAVAIADVTNIPAVADTSVIYGAAASGGPIQPVLSNIAFRDYSVLNQVQKAAWGLCPEYSIVITEISRDTPGGPDVTEGFEIMNASDQTIDLYNYKVWRYHDPNNIWENIESVTASSAVSAYLKGAPLSDTPGQYLLEPGEIAFCWTIFSHTYDNGYASVDPQGNRVYDYVAFRERVLADQGDAFDPNCRIIPFDVLQNGSRFNLTNSNSFRLYVTSRDDTIDAAIAIADVTTPLSIEGKATVYGPEASGDPHLVTLDRLSPSSYTRLTDAQKKAWSVTNSPAQYGLVITEVCRNQTGADITEGFEIMNLSDHSIDLYNYKVWRYHDPGNVWSVIESATAANAIPANLRNYNLSETPGQYVLEPREIAFCWTIFVDTYDNGYASTDAQGNPVYNYALFRQTVQQQQDIVIPEDFKIIPLDSTRGSGRFNMGNSNCFRLYVTGRNETIDESSAIADVTDVSAIADSSTVFGPAAGGGPVLSVIGRSDASSYSVLTDKQRRAWGVPFSYSLVITEVCRDIEGSDLIEGFEIMNTSDKPLDLYNFKVWRYHDSDNDWANISGATAASAVPENLRSFNLSESPGQYVLEPGEIAFCWTVSGDAYDAGFAVKDAEGNPTYYLQQFRNRVLADQGAPIDPNCKIIPLDSTIGSLRFNLGNSICYRLYITANGEDIDGAIAIADVTDTTSTPNTSIIYGQKYDGGPLERVINTLNTPDYSRLSASQGDQWSAGDPANYSLVITEVCRDCTGTDYTECVEIMNVSSSPIDLYSYKIWRYNDPAIPGTR